MSLAQCYQSLPREKITDKFLWGRLEPMLGYLSVEQRSKVLEGLNLAFDSHSGQVGGLLSGMHALYVGTGISGSIASGIYIITCIPFIFSLSIPL